MTKKRKPSTKWDRKLWGVRFDSPNGDPLLIGELWHDSLITSRHAGEPTRTLLFTTRDAARAWCNKKMERLIGVDDCRARWKFTPVRVRELVYEI